MPTNKCAKFLGHLAAVAKRHKVGRCQATQNNRFGDVVAMVTTTSSKVTALRCRQHVGVAANVFTCAFRFGTIVAINPA